MPSALVYHSARGKKFDIYRNELLLALPILGKDPGETILNVLYQGCSDKGFCYPPHKKAIKLTINTDLALESVSIESNNPKDIEEVQPQINPISQLFVTQNWLMIILSFYGFGLLLAFTPCVFPMIPVLSGIIIGHGHKITTRKAFLLSLSYVLSMSITYAGIGGVIASFGKNIQVLMQSPVTLGLFSLLFVFLALSMFGLYDLRLPLTWQNRLASVTRSHEGGHYLSAALMGSLSILILSPCVTPPLIGALGYIAQTGNIFLGMFSLFFLSLGMGSPLLLIGTSAGKFLPHAGQWMNGVKAFFGIILLGVAIYLISRILPQPVPMFFWATLLIFSGLFAGAFIIGCSHLGRIRQGLGLISLTYGILILIGASQGSTNPLQPLQVKHELTSKIEPSEIIYNLEDAKKALLQARGTPVILDFYADWCTSCKEIAKNILQNPKVLSLLNQFTFLKIDLSSNNTYSQDLLNYFNVVAPPTFLIFNPQGDELKQLRIVGEVRVSTFIQNLKAGLDSKKP